MSKSLKLKIKTYEKTQGICIICRKMIEKQPAHWSLEHFLPRAIYKWLPDPELETRLESPANLFVVHKHCNLAKDSHLPNVAQIRRLPVPAHIKDELEALYWWTKPYFAQYTAIKQSTWDRQNRQCAFCSRNIALARATLRRRDNQFARSRDNAMCLCLPCSVRAGNPHYKRKMVAKRQLAITEPQP